MRTGECKWWMDGGGWGWGGGLGGAQGVERLNVSTWLVIRSDYHRLTAPTGRHPWLLRLPPLLPLKRVRECKQEGERESLWEGRCVRLCVYICVWDESAVDEPQTDPAPSPLLTSAAQYPARAQGGTSSGAVCKTTPWEERASGRGRGLVRSDWDAMR